MVTMEATWLTIKDLMARGGWVMWPLLALSVVALTLIFERCWFWIKTNNPTARNRINRVAELLRGGQRDKAWLLAERDGTVYGDAARRMLGEKASHATAADAVENQRHRLERFMPTLGTIITAAPMLGILGTVTGIIRAFRVLSDTEMVTDPGKIGAGIAEALLTTVAGLVVALIVLFPYNAFRAQIDRTLGRLEALAAAAEQNAQPEEM